MSQTHTDTDTVAQSANSVAPQEFTSHFERGDVSLTGHHCLAAAFSVQSRRPDKSTAQCLLSVIEASQLPVLVQSGLTTNDRLFGGPKDRSNQTFAFWCGIDSPGIAPLWCRDAPSSNPASPL